MLLDLTLHAQSPAAILWRILQCLRLRLPLCLHLRLRPIVLHPSVRFPQVYTPPRLSLLLLFPPGLIEAIKVEVARNSYLPSLHPSSLGSGLGAPTVGGEGPNIQLVELLGEGSFGKVGGQGRGGKERWKRLRKTGERIRFPMRFSPLSPLPISPSQGTHTKNTAMVREAVWASPVSPAEHAVMRN